MRACHPRKGAWVHNQNDAELGEGWWLSVLLEASITLSSRLVRISVANLRALRQYEVHARGPTSKAAANSN